ncbi:hypothetical protein C5Y96_06950 [Blastopirellula marina]|uniref:Uncharacterized protein n=1 Tax=Blastopirellula marina TaxID=124 RepID=A0A2S8FYH5_9BACT|nr:MULTISPECIES: hypothetical protein [Pirellulaceae]PQO36894.1 hypothetical protein C5Y96_06950 [Blastopirellula marina]RCS53609.1 hypothetical protein DTL36_06960 [Bremerella cremea]
MKLGILLLSVGALWSILGAMVLGVGVLLYPVAWAAVFAVLYGVHKIADSRQNKSLSARNLSEKPSGDLSHADLSRDQNAAWIR